MKGAVFMHGKEIVLHLIHWHLLTVSQTGGANSIMLLVGQILAAGHHFGTGMVQIGNHHRVELRTLISPHMPPGCIHSYELLKI